MPPGSKSSKPKASEVAAETKRIYIPWIKQEFANDWPTYSYLYQAPLEQLAFEPTNMDLSPPTFWVRAGDEPVDSVISWAQSLNKRVPFICAANDKRAGGDWETGVLGYEERLCRRSNLSACLSTPGPGSQVGDNYPIPLEGGIYTDHVVVFRSPHDRYDVLPTEMWASLPVVSLTPMRWPKLNHGGTKYSFASERDMMKNKLRAALRICAYNGFDTIVIGDFGLGNGHRNPPRELAEIWREVFLYDPDLRGRIRDVAFVFEDHTQSTMRLIQDDIVKKTNKGSSSSSKGKAKASGSSASASGSSSSGAGLPTDFEIYSHVFDKGEIDRVLAERDARYDLGMLTS